MTKLVALIALASSASSVAFVPTHVGNTHRGSTDRIRVVSQSTFAGWIPQRSGIHHCVDKRGFALSLSDAVFVPDEEKQETEATSDDDALEKAEKLGRGSAKAKRGKRKGGGADASQKKVAASLTPEEVYYEGPPAITETIIPTISILTVVGIIPAAAAWSRQAWVRYKITTRRIRVTSGIGGKDMAEIVYPDIVELRTVKRLFGDGDMVAFLRDGAKFEMRNIPNFDSALEFILQQVDKDVAATYRAKGDVTKPE